ncbi:hypothetical protein ACIQB5_50670, partial [Streptomyces sp. NPDC088560]|uniref:hypothetical protein n=1 Tax=Streptomyces sp. NPDC088560 TaxID=3365868 RepID=UPI003815C9AA
PGYPLGPQLNLLDRQPISTQSHQRQATLIVTPDAVAVLAKARTVIAVQGKLSVLPDQFATDSAPTRDGEKNQ